MQRNDIYCTRQNGRKSSKWVENTLGKGEIAHYEQFLLFPQCFQKTCNANRWKPGINWERVKCRHFVNHKSITITEKWDRFEWETNPPITYNYVCFLTNYESVGKMPNGLIHVQYIGFEHCASTNNVLSVWSICSETEDFTWTFFNSLPHNPDLEIEGFWKHYGKRRKCWQAVFSPFPTMFSTHLKPYFSFLFTFILLSANAFNLDQSKFLLFGEGLNIFW